MPVAAQLKVLIVDDQASMRGITRFILQQLGIRDTTEAKDGREGLEAMAVKQFHLVLSDWNMPGVDGLTFLKTIRANPLLKKTPFIMATGKGELDQVKEAAQAGVNNYVVKPFNAATLKAKIEAVLGKLT